MSEQQANATSPTVQEPGFSVRLSTIRAGACNAVRGDDTSCHEAPTLVATLVYCNCGEAHRPAETCPEGAPEGEPDLVPVCERHGAAIRASWECFRRLTTYRAEVSA